MHDRGPPNEFALGKLPKNPPKGGFAWSGTASIRRPLVIQTHRGCRATFQYMSLGPISLGS